jgi:DNA polymerase-3 subunit epsilon
VTATDQPRLDHDLRCASWDSGNPATCDCRDDSGHTSTPWHEGPWVSFDTETTGVEVATDRIVTATVVVYIPGSEPVATEWLADPGVEIPAEAAAVHGITTEIAREHGRPAAEVIAELAEMLATVWTATVPLIAYNGAFDLDITDNEMRRHLRRRLVVHGPMIDPRILDKQHDRYRRGSRKLVDVCAHYRVSIGNAHDATEDALAAARVAWRIAQASKAIGSMTLPELHAAQVRWFAEQQRSFADYLRKKVAPGIEDEAERQEVLDRADTIDAHADGWPLRGVA